MKKIKVEITEDMLKLITCIKFKEEPNKNSEEEQKLNYYIDFFSLYGGNFLLEDLSMILGQYDKRIEGTENDWFGPVFPDDVKEYMLDVHFKVLDNLGNIEEILHQFAAKGGLRVGTYSTKPNEHIWTFEENS